MVSLSLMSNIIFCEDNKNLHENNITSLRKTSQKTSQKNYPENHTEKPGKLRQKILHNRFAKGEQRQIRHSEMHTSKTETNNGQVE